MDLKETSRSAKQQLRTRFKQIRQQISDKDKRSQDILRQAIKLPKYQKAKAVFCYISHPDEVSTRDLLRQSISEGKDLFVPVMLTEMIYLARYTGGEELIEKDYGIMEPQIKPDRIYHPGEVGLDVIFVPGMVFNFRGMRIGSGNGHFDNFLHHYPESYKVGLAFLEQVVEDDLPTESHDQMLDFVLVG